MTEGRKKNQTVLLRFVLIVVLIFAPISANAAAMSAAEINNFLIGKNSWLANNTIAEYISVQYPVAVDGSIAFGYVDARQAYTDIFYNKTVAQLIYDEAYQHNINPQLILVMLQRESEAVTQSSPSSPTRLGWPLFYNYDERMADCLLGDVASCNDTKYNHPTYRERAYDYGGVGQQIAYATAQLRKLHDDSSYCGGSLVVSVDGGNLTADNAATCALYKYTPHAVSYSTSSAFYTNWQSWWSATPNGGGYSATNTISESNFVYNTPAPPPTAPPPRKVGDANGDGSVGSTDLSILADQWGKNVAANTGADYNGDGVVDSTDLSILADAWGK